MNLTKKKMKRTQIRAVLSYLKRYLTLIFLTMAIPRTPLNVQSAILTTQSLTSTKLRSKQKLSLHTYTASVSWRNNSRANELSHPFCKRKSKRRTSNSSKKLQNFHLLALRMNRCSSRHRLLWSVFKPSRSRIWIRSSLVLAVLQLIKMRGSPWQCQGVF